MSVAAAAAPAPKASGVKKRAAAVRGTAKRQAADDAADTAVVAVTVSPEERYADAVHAIQYCQTHNPTDVAAHAMAHANDSLGGDAMAQAYVAVRQCFVPCMLEAREIIDYMDATKRDVSTTAVRQRELHALDERRVHGAREKFSVAALRADTATLYIEDAELRHLFQHPPGSLVGAAAAAAATAPSSNADSDATEPEDSDSVDSSLCRLVDDLFDELLPDVSWQRYHGDAGIGMRSTS